MQYQELIYNTLSIYFYLFYIVKNFTKLQSTSEILNKTQYIVDFIKQTVLNTDELSLIYRTTKKLS